MFEIFRGMIIDFDLNPTFGSETGKIRPCIVVTNDVYNRRVPVIQVVPITEWNENKVTNRDEYRVATFAGKWFDESFDRRLPANAPD